MTAISINPTTIRETARPNHTAAVEPLAELKAPGKGHSLFNTTFSAVTDYVGRAADIFDDALTLPKTVGDVVAGLNIPGVSWAATTIGAFFVNSFKATAYMIPLGGSKWLQGLRRWTGVENGYNDAKGDIEEIPMYTAAGFISSVRDPRLQGGLAAYFEAHSKLQEVRFDTTLSDDERQSAELELKRELTHIELNLARYAELKELQELIGADGDNHPATHALLENLADQKASEMIARVEQSFKGRLGGFGSEMKGVWLSLASGGAEKREEIRQGIKMDLISAYEAEQRGESAKAAMERVRIRLHEAFLSSGTLREAGFFAGFGLLGHLGLHGFGSSLIQDSVHDIGNAVTSALGWVWDQMAPDAVKEFVSQALLYSKLALGSVLALYGAKGVAAVYTFGKGFHDVFGGHTSMESSAARAAEPPSPSDVRPIETPHLDASRAVVDPLQQHLDAARDAALHPDTSLHAPDTAALMQARGVDASATSSLTPELSTVRPHGEMRLHPDSVRPDVHVEPRVHIK